MVTKIWYSVQNGGDGSAYPELMESEELAELDQDWMDEGWGEPCVGCIVVDSESPIIVRSVTTIDDAIKEIEEELNSDYMKKYKEQGKYPGWFKRLEGKLEALIKLKGD